MWKKIYIMERWAWENDTGNVLTIHHLLDKWQVELDNKLLKEFHSMQFAMDYAEKYMKT
jgi:signal-transduction protein with cAMP-binding, CBS, and nucleotidyltransferase domain